MNSKFIFGLLAAIVAFSGYYLLVQEPKKTDQGARGTYCSPEGTLSNRKPIQSHRSYCLKSNAGSYAANTPTSYAFEVVTDEGETVKGHQFAETHTKLMHVIVVRKDLTNFQHLHPALNATSGLFTISDLTFPADGEYRIFADFVPKEGMMLPVTISEDVTVGSKYNPQGIGGEERSKTFRLAQVTLSATEPLISGKEAMLTFDLKESGKAVTNLEEYLGALGHSIALREGTLDFIHAHPMNQQVQNGKVRFMVTFPQAGKYKIFTQFQRNGSVFSTDFVVSIDQGEETLMPEMDHSMH